MAKEQGNAGQDLALMKRDVVDVVTGKINGFITGGQLHLPDDYSAENALKAAWLELQNVKDSNDKPALQACTKDSIANALLDMVIQGLTPVKDQCYFVAYGKQLVLLRSYFGTAGVMMRLTGAREPWTEVVYQGDEFHYEVLKNRKQVVKHVQKLENIDPKKIVAAYCVIEFTDGRPDYTEIMTIEQMKAAWRQGQTYKGDQGGSFHVKFTDQACKRTVINRACKLFINASTDKNLVLREAYNRTQQAIVEDEVENEAEQLANGEVIDIEASEKKQEAAAEDNGPGNGEASGDEQDNLAGLEPPPARGERQASADKPRF